MNKLKSYWSRVYNKFFGEYPVPPPEAKEEPANTWTQEMLSTVTTTILEGVKVAMATLLSIFVPQFCEETGTTCTLQENFSNLSTFNEAVIVWNFLTLGLFCVLSYVQTKRETYFISHLDENLEQPYNSFVKNCKSYPKIVNRVKHHNDKLYFWSYLVVVSFIVNIIISSILVFYYFYDGFRTAATLLANVLLVSNKLYSYWDVCTKCRQAKMLALSTVKLIPASFNSIDGEYKAPIKRKREYNTFKLKTGLTLRKKRKLFTLKQQPRHRLNSIKVESVPLKSLMQAQDKVTLDQLKINLQTLKA